MFSSGHACTACAYAIERIVFFTAPGTGTLYYEMLAQQRARTEASLKRAAPAPDRELDVENLMEISLHVCFTPIFAAYKLLVSTC